MQPLLPAAPNKQRRSTRVCSSAAQQIPAGLLGYAGKTAEEDEEEELPGPVSGHPGTGLADPAGANIRNKMAAAPDAS